MIKCCAVCGKPITARFWVCRACEEAHGLVKVKYRNWPEWVKECVRPYRRQRTLDKRELAFADIRGFDPFEYITKDGNKCL